MKVQLLTFPGCPNARAARQALRDALDEARLPVEFEELDVTAPSTPEALRAWGSPTILIDGKDVAGERAPTGPCCRLYDGSPHRRGVPSQEIIGAALRAAGSRRRGWLRSLAPLPGALLALLPAATCPACLVGYAGLLSAIGLGFLATERVLVPLILLFLAIGIATMAWSARSHRQMGPIAMTLLGSAAVVAGRVIWSFPAALYGGVALLALASLWNLRLRRPGTPPLVRVRRAQ